MNPGVQYEPGGLYPLTELDWGIQFEGGPNPLGQRPSDTDTVSDLPTDVRKVREDSQDMMNEILSDLLNENFQAFLKEVI